MLRIFFILGAAFAGVGVAAGAFGAHGLARILPAERLQTFETAVRYLMYHAFALLVVALASSSLPQQHGLLSTAGWLFTAGILLFSGSLFALVLSGQGWLGAITPLGGIAMVAGWFCLLLAFRRS